MPAGRAASPGSSWSGARARTSTSACWPTAASGWSGGWPAGAGRRLRLRDDLQANVADSEARLDRLVRRIEVAAGRRVGRDDVRPVDVRPAVRGTLDLRAAGITNVVWCTGQHPSYPWLQLPVHDRSGAIRQRRGVTAVPGLYVVGTKFQHRRDSTFLDGLRHDARDVVDPPRRRVARPGVRAGCLAGSSCAALHVSEVSGPG